MKPIIILHAVVATLLLTGCGSKDSKQTASQASAADGIELNETNFPDVRLRETLSDTRWGKDGVITSEELTDITSLDLAGQDIHSLQGIDLFTELSTLVISDNPVETFDASQLPQLTELYAVNCRLRQLEVGGMNQLVLLNCNENQLSELLCGGCRKLEKLCCSGNEIGILNIFDCKSLQSIDVSGNDLHAVFLGNATHIREARIAGNPLTESDLDIFVKDLPEAEATNPGDAADQPCVLPDIDSYTLTPYQEQTLIDKGWEF